MVTCSLRNFSEEEKCRCDFAQPCGYKEQHRYYNTRAVHVTLYGLIITNTDIHITGSNTQLRFLPVANKAYTVRVAELKIDKPDSVSSNQTYNL